MKTAKILVVGAVAACIVSAMAGCHSSSQNATQIEDRSSFKGGPMPANVSQIIAQRAQMSAARAAQHPANAH